MPNNKGKILIIDDNIQILNSLKLLLKTEFEQIDLLKNPNQLISQIQKFSYDVILLDMNFTTGSNTGNEGFFWLNEILKYDSQAVVILITAYGDIELAVKAIKLGATDFITKPWNADKLITTLKTAYELRCSKLEVNDLKGKQKQLIDDFNRKYKLIIGKSKEMNQIYSTIEKVAKTDANILILGENGTGKELIAREIHRKSLRANEIFLSVDMASLNENIFESEMFGHTKGAFTDAKEDRIGRFESAYKGTLFLDEIGNLSMNMQAKLLSAIQNRQISKMGSNKLIPIDIRLITATNKPVFEMVKQNSFREDLLYRINTIQIELPPLRERTEDIAMLADFYLNQFANQYGKTGIKINEAALDKLIQYQWPGNIRELKHTIEKAVILSDSDVLAQEDFFFKNSIISNTSSPASLKLTDMEKWTIENVLKKCKGNLSKAAEILDISRTTLYSKIEKYNLTI